MTMFMIIFAELLRVITKYPVFSVYLRLCEILLSPACLWNDYKDKVSFRL